MKFSTILVTALLSTTTTSVDAQTEDKGGRQLRGMAGITFGVPANIAPELIEEALDVGVPLKTIMSLSNNARLFLLAQTSSSSATTTTTNNNNNGRSLQKSSQQQYHAFANKDDKYLSNRATMAMSTAVLATFRDPEGKIDSELFNRALQQGVPVETFLTSLTKLFEQRQRTLLETIQHTTRRLLSLQTTRELRQQQALPPDDLVEPDVLSNQAMRALSRAVLSGYRSATGEMDEHLVEAAVEAGAPRQLIMDVMAKTMQDTKTPISSSSSQTTDESLSVKADEQSLDESNEH